MRITLPRVLGLALISALAGYVFIVVPHMPGTTLPAPSAAANVERAAAGQLVIRRNGGAFPSAGKKFIGIFTNSGPYNYSALDSFTSAVGKPPSVFEFSQGWGVNKFDAATINSVARRGMLPIISWEPWKYHLVPNNALSQGHQPAYSLSRIIDGHYDSYIRSWALGIKSLGYPVAIRFAQEMNGNWYPWGVGNGNRPGQFVRAWRHVHNIFTEVGATNVIWIWAPNILWNGSPNLRQFYPGNSYVTWIGLSGYYGTPGMGDYKTFNQIFQPTIADLRAFTSKPILVAETGATNVSGLMPRWITEMFKQLPTDKNIIGVIWFEAVNVIDWRVTSYPAADAAFRAGYASKLYDDRWVPGMTARLGGPPR